MDIWSDISIEIDCPELKQFAEEVKHNMFWNCKIKCENDEELAAVLDALTDAGVKWANNKLPKEFRPFFPSPYPIYFLVDDGLMYWTDADEIFKDCSADEVEVKEGDKDMYATTDITENSDIRDVPIPPPACFRNFYVRCEDAEKTAKILQLFEWLGLEWFTTGKKPTETAFKDKVYPTYIHVLDNGKLVWAGARNITTDPLVPAQDLLDMYETKKRARDKAHQLMAEVSSHEKIPTQKEWNLQRLKTLLEASLRTVVCDNEYPKFEWIQEMFNLVPLPEKE